MTPAPSADSIKRIRNYVEKYWRKTGTSAHPDPEITDAVITGLALHLEQLGHPLCPCNFYPDKQAEVAASRRWICPCDEMRNFKYCHCLLFVTPAGHPITEHLPEDHPGRRAYEVDKEHTDS